MRQWAHFSSCASQTCGVTRAGSLLTSRQGGTTLASAVFGGALRSEVKAAGAPASATLEPCFVVHLDIHPETVHSVADALRAFTSAETISGACDASEVIAQACEGMRLQLLSRSNALKVL